MNNKKQYRQMELKIYLLEQDAVRTSGGSESGVEVDYQQQSWGSPSEGFDDPFEM